MDNADIKKQSDTELKELLAQMRESLRIMRFKLSSGDLKQVRSIRENRKLVARILTELNARAQREQA